MQHTYIDSYEGARGGCMIKKKLRFRQLDGNLGALVEAKVVNPELCGFIIQRIIKEYENARIKNTL